MKTQPYELYVAFPRLEISNIPRSTKVSEAACGASYSIQVREGVAYFETRKHSGTCGRHLAANVNRLTMSGYNMQTGIRTAFEAEVHEEGRIVLNARLFGEIIRDDLVVFAADENI